jgi:hypothetical protein
LFDAVTGNLLHTFANPTPAFGDYFGGAIATTGDTVVIGAPMMAYGYPVGTGAAYVFTHTGPTWNDWQLSQTYTGSADSELGVCVASVGNGFLIGAPGENQSSGAAYWYETPSSLPIQIPNPNNTPGDRFGSSVAGVGSTKVIGAPNTQNLSGAVYKYDGLTLSGRKAGNAGELFGDSVALMGNNVLAGAPYNHSDGNQGGAAYLLDGSEMDLNGSIDSQIHKFDNPHQGVGEPGLGARFGSFVVPVGDNILVSAIWDDAAGPYAGAAYLFDGNGNLLLPPMLGSPGSDDNFGHGPSAMGNNILVGAVYADDLGVPNSGAAYLIQGIPEPSTLVLLGIGTLSLLGYAWRRRKRAG